MHERRVNLAVCRQVERRTRFQTSRALHLEMGRGTQQVKGRQTDAAIRQGDVEGLVILPFKVGEADAQVLNLGVGSEGRKAAQAAGQLSGTGGVYLPSRMGNAQAPEQGIKTQAGVLEI